MVTVHCANMALPRPFPITLGYQWINATWVLMLCVWCCCFGCPAGLTNKTLPPSSSSFLFLQALVAFSVRKAAIDMSRPISMIEKSPLVSMNSRVRSVLPCEAMTLSRPLQLVALGMRREIQFSWNPICSSSRSQELISSR